MSIDKGSILKQTVIILLAVGVSLGVVLLSAVDRQKPVRIRMPGAALQGAVGRIDGAGRQAEEGRDTAGALSYGPYLVLPPGSYEFRLRYNASSETSGTYDIVFRGSTKLLRKGTLKATTDGWLVERVRISQADEDKALEFRIWYTGRGTLRVDRITVRSHQMVLSRVPQGVIMGLVAGLLFLLCLSANATTGIAPNTEPSRIALPLLLASMLVLYYPFALDTGALEILRDLTIIYGSLFVGGVGLYFLLTPDSMKHPLLLPFLCPVYAVALFSVINVYVMLFNGRVADTIYISFAVALAALVLSLVTRGKRVMAQTRELGARWSQLLAIFVTGAILLLTILAPAIKSGHPTTTYRLNIDQAGYAQAAQFLLEGGTLKDVKREILKQVGTTDLTEAVTRRQAALKSNSWMNAEFFLRGGGTRTGLISMLSAFALVTGSDHVLRIQFVSLGVIYAILFGLFFCLLFVFLALPEGLALLAAAAMSLNANLLNIYYEGLNAQIFFMPILLILFMAYMLVRRDAFQRGYRESLRYIISPPARKYIAFVSLFLAASFSLYGEGILVFLALVLLCAAIDYLFSRRLSMPSLALFALAAIVGMVAIAPQVYQYMNWLFFFLDKRTTGGIWQPSWASVAEIAGIFNMYTGAYTHGVPKLLGRTDLSVLINAVTSGAILVFAGTYLFRHKSLDRPLWLAAPLFVLTVFVQTHYVDNTLNYMYTKAYTILLPFLLVLVSGALEFYTHTDRPVLNRLATGLKFFFFASIFISGILYIQGFEQDGRTVSRDMFDLYRENQSSGQRFDSYAFITNKAMIDEFMLVPLIPLHWLNQGIEKKNYAPHLEKQVAIIVRKNGLSDTSVLDKYRGNVLYENPSYMILNTGMKLVDSYNPQRRDCNLSVYTERYREVFR